MSCDKDETAQQRYEKYYFLIVAVGAVVVFSAPWMFGWPQIVLGVAATDIVISAMLNDQPPVDWSISNLSSWLAAPLVRAAQLAGIAKPPARRRRG
jgi:hypothetical protein